MFAFPSLQSGAGLPPFSPHPQHPQAKHVTCVRHDLIPSETCQKKTHYSAARGREHQFAARQCMQHPSRMPKTLHVSHGTFISPTISKAPACNELSSNVHAYRVLQPKLLQLACLTCPIVPVCLDPALRVRRLPAAQHAIWI
jgi:hypothetical protein